MPERVVTHRLEQRHDLFGLPGDGDVACSIGPVVVVDDHTSQYIFAADNADSVETTPVSIVVDLLGDPCSDAFFLVVYKVGHV